MAASSGMTAPLIRSSRSCPISPPAGASILRAFVDWIRTKTAGQAPSLADRVYLPVQREAHAHLTGRVEIAQVQIRRVDEGGHVGRVGRVADDRPQPPLAVRTRIAGAQVDARVARHHVAEVGV